MYDLNDDLNDNEPFVHYELRRSTIQRAVQAIENKRARKHRLLVAPKQRERRGDNIARMNAAFARAALEERELRDLRAKYPTYSGLRFRRADNDNQTNEETT